MDVSSQSVDMLQFVSEGDIVTLTLRLFVDAVSATVQIGSGVDPALAALPDFASISLQMTPLDALSPPADSDDDGVADLLDNCPSAANPNQNDTDLDLIGDVCDPFPNDPDNEQAQCEVDLGQCLVSGGTDADSDGIPENLDLCASTSLSEAVDADGCSLTQFCALVDATLRGGSRLCKKSDWQNDEPLMRGSERDCTKQRNGFGRADDTCVPVGP